MRRRAWDMRAAFRRLPSPSRASDFLHHAAGVVRLNNGSFGAAPLPVQQAEAAHRSRWLANPDAFYFGTGSASLDGMLSASAATAAKALAAPVETVALVENATVAAAVVGQRWAAKLRERSSEGGSAVLLLDVCYKAVAYSLAHFCEPAGGRLVYSTVPFPGTSAQAVLDNLEATLRETRPRFAMLDHVSSQPALKLPVREMVELCRAHGVEEIAIDAAHTIGNVPASEHDAPSIGADFLFVNMHKWAMCPSPVTALYAREELASETHHVVPSWHAGSGLLQESRWTGTRDYAGFLTVPEALDYLKEWRSVDGLDAVEYNATGQRQAAQMLREAWQVDECVQDEEISSGMAMSMVRLPRSLDLSADLPGQPSAGVRSTLRDRYGIEAAVGGFGEHGGFVRLSHAIYNSDEDYERLRDAVAEMAAI